ncbi:MAG: LysR substrate-binding domain-containing protein [Actinomycetota bacterium]|nr:LysR substrate-binding domain-containing protein [Actinomycetota bacterium]
MTPAVGPQDRTDIVRALRTDSHRSVTLREVRPGDLRQSLRDRSVDLVLACVSGTAGEALDRADLRPSRMQVHVPAGHPLAGAQTAGLEDFDGERLLTASPPRTPYTDLLVERFASAGATVTPVEARVTGGAHMLTELVEADAIAAMPVGTSSPSGVCRLDIPAFTMPLLVLWTAGRPPQAVGRLRATMHA